MNSDGHLGLSYPSPWGHGKVYFSQIQGAEEFIWSFSSLNLSTVPGYTEQLLMGHWNAVGSFQMAFSFPFVSVFGTSLGYNSRLSLSSAMHHMVLCSIGACPNRAKQKRERG